MLDSFKGHIEVTDVFPPWPRSGRHGDDILTGRLTDHGGASCQRRPRALVEVVSRRHASVGHLETRVHIDAAGHQHASVGVDGFDAAWHNEVFSNLSETTQGNKKRKKIPATSYRQMCVSSLDDAVLHVNVGAEGLVIVHDLRSFDQETIALQNREEAQLPHVFQH